MDSAKIGKLILKLRKEKGYTQKYVADRLNISDKAVSRWERGVGFPDISLWPELSSIFGVGIKELFEGELSPNEIDIGNISKISFYVCKQCGNVLTSTSKSGISCCGRELLALILDEKNDEHKMIFRHIDNNINIVLEHEMQKTHYIAFVAFVTDSSIWINHLYPEQSAETNFPDVFRKGTIYCYCNKHGLSYTKYNKRF